MQTRSFCRVPRKASKLLGGQGERQLPLMTQPMCLVSRKTLVADFLTERCIPPGVQLIVRDYAHPAVIDSSSQQFFLGGQAGSVKGIQNRVSNSARLAIDSNGTMFATINGKLFRRDGDVFTDLFHDATAVHWDTKTSDMLCIGAYGTTIERFNGNCGTVHMVPKELPNRLQPQLRNLVVGADGSIYLACSAMKLGSAKTVFDYIVKCSPTMELDTTFISDEDSANRIIDLALNEQDGELFFLEQGFIERYDGSTMTQVVVLSSTTGDFRRIISLQNSGAKDRLLDQVPRCIAYFADTLVVATADRITGYSPRCGLEVRLFQTDLRFGSIRDICIRDNTLAVLDVRPNDTKVKIHKLLLG